MTSKQSTVDLILDCIAAAGAVSARKMFGEYGLYCDGTFFGLVCDDQLFVKPTHGARTLLADAAQEGPPYPGAKPHLLVPGDSWDDCERLASLVRVTAAELRRPTSKTAGARRQKQLIR